MKHTVIIELVQVTGSEVLIKLNGLFISFSGNTFFKGCELWNLIKLREAEDVHKSIGSNQRPV